MKERSRERVREKVEESKRAKLTGTSLIQNQDLRVESRAWKVTRDSKVEDPPKSRRRPAARDFGFEIGIVTTQSEWWFVRRNQRKIIANLASKTTVCGLWTEVTKLRGNKKLTPVAQ